MATIVKQIQIEKKNPAYAFWSAERVPTKPLNIYENENRNRRLCSVWCVVVLSWLDLAWFFLHFFMCIH